MGRLVNPSYISSMMMFYIVVQMEPTLSGVQALLNLLNQTSNLKEFCKLLRLKFKHHISAQQNT